MTERKHVASSVFHTDVVQAFRPARSGGPEGPHYTLVNNALVASFWTDDVTVRRALGQPRSGRAAAIEALQPAGPPASRLVYQRLTREIDVSPNWPLAFETGTWEGHLGSLTGATTIGGRYSAQWVKRGDKWLIRSEVFVALTCSGAGCQSAAVP